MEIKLQSLLFPDKEEYTDYQALFFKSGQGIYNKQEKYLAFARYSVCDFATYLNALSYRKWRKHSKAGEIYLKLKVKGNFELVLSGYHRIEEAAKRVTFTIKEYDLPEKQEIIVKIPESKETLVGFELRTYTDCMIYEGGYYTEIPDNQLNEVRLSIATTTFRKESFIKKNIKMIKEELLDKDDIVSQNLYVHVVDNDEGRVLKREEIEGKHVFYHPNKNV